MKMHLPCKSYIIIATFFYVGYLPIAPGTWGSLAALIVFIGIFSKLSPLVYFVSILALFFLGMWASEKTDAYEKSHDNGIIVIDEVVGMLATLFLIEASLANLILGFIIFRIFDVVKIPPANVLDEKESGFGTMGDDLVSGIYANIALHAINWFFV